MSTHYSCSLATLATLCLCSLSLACSGKQSEAGSQASLVVSSMHDSLLQDIRDLEGASQALQGAAPRSGAGFSAASTPGAVAAMKTAWQSARTAYEQCEGALAPIFPDLDFSLDARYDDFLALLPDGDADLFDDQGVIGLHAVERILYSDVIPARVTAFEEALPGYRAAAFPDTATQAKEFREQLLSRLISDSHTLEQQWTPAKIDLAAAFGGLISLMNEQREKVNKASTNEEESRYSQRTMHDIRANLAGTVKIYGLFRSWLRSKTNGLDPTLDGPTLDAAVTAGLARLQALYDQTPGDAIPEPPATWSAENPSRDDLQTPFGQLYAGVLAAVDPVAPDSVVFNMNQAANVLGLSQP